jgi:membrane-bound ClpP family serine protease
MARTIITWIGIVLLVAGFILILRGLPVAGLVISVIGGATALIALFAKADQTQQGH